MQLMAVGDTTGQPIGLEPDQRVLPWLAASFLAGVARFVRQDYVVQSTWL
jgi:hypothetical protein